jgi:drug/metabolite transporter (DMT)-like permease
VTASLGTLLVLVGAGGLLLNPLGLILGFGAAVTYTGYTLVSDTVVHRLPLVVLSTLVMPAQHSHSPCATWRPVESTSASG